MPKENNNEVKTDLSEVVESQIVQSVIAYQQAGGEVEFMEGEVIKITDQNYAHSETAKNYRNWMAKGANEAISHLRILANVSIVHSS